MTQARPAPAPAPAPTRPARPPLRRPPAVRPPPRRPARGSGTLGRLARRAAAALSVLVLLVSVGGYALLTYFDGRIGRIHLWFGADRPSAVAGVQNWLLVGTDSRAGTGGEYSRGGPNQEDNSDTQILAHLSPDGTTTLVSFPRDTYVPIPAYTDSHGVTHPAHNGKMNSALPTGGPSLLVHTLETVTGLRIDHYASVDLAGFKTMTDALGGVDVCVRASPHVETGVDDTGRPYRATNLDDPFSQFHAAPGTVHLDGEQALAFVRQRHGFPDGDLSRIRRQQTFLGAVMNTATSSRIDLVRPGDGDPAARRGDRGDDRRRPDLPDCSRSTGRFAARLDPAKWHFQTIPTHTPSPGAALSAGVRRFQHAACLSPVPGCPVSPATVGDREPRASPRITGLPSSRRWASRSAGGHPGSCPRTQLRAPVAR